MNCKLNSKEINILILFGAKIIKFMSLIVSINLLFLWAYKYRSINYLIFKNEKNHLHYVDCCLFSLCAG